MPTGKHSSVTPLQQPSSSLTPKKTIKWNCLYRWRLGGGSVQVERKNSGSGRNIFKRAHLHRLTYIFWYLALVHCFKLLHFCPVFPSSTPIPHSYPTLKINEGDPFPPKEHLPCERWCLWTTSSRSQNKQPSCQEVRTRGAARCRSSNLLRQSTRRLVRWGRAFYVHLCSFLLTWRRYYFNPDLR